MVDALRVILTAALSFAALFLVAKLMGKKQIAQLTFADYAVGISIGSIAAQMAVDSQIPVHHFLIAMAVYLMLDMLIALLVRKFILLKGILQGKPILIIENGKLLYGNLKKSRLDLSEFLSLCRAKNFFNINDIAFCIFETNGEISILPKASAAPVACDDMNIKKEKPGLSIDFIMDGKIIDKALRQANKTKEWLLKEMNISDESKVKDISLATYNSQNDAVIFYDKKEKEQSG